jgi:His/Glu/Gln/Arg/opine family amino acid ABC transporter permease subunit
MLSISKDMASGDAMDVDSTQLEYVRRRHWGRYIASAVILAIVVYIGLAFAHGQIEWTYVARFLTAKSILTGLVNTIVMTILAMALGVALGVITAIMRLSTNPVLQTVAQAYVWLFRGTPVILQLLLWFNPRAGVSVDRRSRPLRVPHCRHHDAVPRGTSGARHQPGGVHIGSGAGQVCSPSIQASTKRPSPSACRGCRRCAA